MSTNPRTELLEAWRVVERAARIHQVTISGGPSWNPDLGGCIERVSTVINAVELAESQPQPDIETGGQTIARLLNEQGQPQPAGAVEMADRLVGELRHFLKRHFKDDCYHSGFSPVGTLAAYAAARKGWVEQEWTREGPGRNQLAEAFLRGIEAGAESPELSGDGDAMYQAFKDWLGPIPVPPPPVSPSGGVEKASRPDVEPGTRDAPSE